MASTADKALLTGHEVGLVAVRAPGGGSPREEPQGPPAHCPAPQPATGLRGAYLGGVLTPQEARGGQAGLGKPSSQEGALAYECPLHLLSGGQGAYAITGGHLRAPNQSIGKRGS